MSTIKLKRSSVPNNPPNTGQLELGEVAINTHDGKMYIKQDANGAISIVEIGKREVADNVWYVSENGDDTNNDGKSIAYAFRTIDQALSVAAAGDTIFVKSGTHTVDNTAGGVLVPTNVSIYGDNLRTTKIKGAQANNDIFWVNNAVQLSNMTFIEHVDGAAAVAFPPDGSAGSITVSPYVQNCSSITTTGTGMYIDGSVVGGLKSMVSDAYTQVNAGGIGIHLTNSAQAQLVSIFTVSCDVGILCENGGQCSLTNSNCSFGNYGLKAVGKSDAKGTATLTADTAPFVQTINVDTNLSYVPIYGDIIQLGSAPNYYTVIETTDNGNNNYDLVLLEPMEDVVLINATVTFYRRSLISASGITFEYVGTGTGIFDTPESGAFPVQANEIIQDADRAGQVYFTSTDHLGNFRIGQDLLINRTEGRIEGETFDRSLFAVLTPYILALEGSS